MPSSVLPVAAAVAAAACVVAPALALAGRSLAVRLTGLLAGATVALVVLDRTGADVLQAATQAVPLVLILGYSAVASLVTRSGAAAGAGQAVAGRPVAVFVLAAALTTVTSNDTVVLALAPLVLVTARPHLSAAALFAGANVAAGLLPQGSPTNLMIAAGGGLDFTGYLATAALPIGAMLATSAVLVALAARRSPSTTRPAASPSLTPLHRRVLAGGALAVLAQPVAEVAGLPSWALGLLLVLGCAALASRIVGAGAGRAVLGDVAWLVLPAGTVMLAAGQLLAPVVGGLGAWASAAILLGVGGVLTDLAAAATAAHLVAAAALPASAALVTVTAGAYLTPLGSLSALLLIQQFAHAGVRVRPVVFVLPAGIALVSWAVGMAVALA